MIKLIITADDYGISNGVNSAILSCVDSGLINSTNVMVNMDYLNNEIRKYANVVSIGIHWNLTAGKCVSKKENVSSLVDKDGFFFPFAELKRRIKKGLVKKEHIIIEIKAQYKKFVDYFGFPPIYWNTHQNLVLIRKISKVFFAVGKELRIKYTRTFSRQYLDYNFLPFFRKVRELIVRLYVDYMYKIKFRRYSLHPDYRLIVFNRENKNNLGLLKKAILRCKNKTSLEMVFHPSETVDSIYFGTIGQERIDEFLFLKENGNDLKSFFENNNIILTGFNDIWEN